MLESTLEPAVLPAIYPRSPLRYPGGKSRAVRFLYPLIPPNETKLAAPFLGGASLELALSMRMEVYGSDLFLPVVEFWQELLWNQIELVNQVREWHPLMKSDFYWLQENYHKFIGKINRAAIYYVLNRASYSGTTFSGGMSPGHPRFTESAIQRLAEFQVSNFYVEHLDYKDALDKYPDLFLYLDPPYEIDQALYGERGNMHKGFNHYELAEILHKRDRWVMSYNDSPHMRELYKDHTILPVQWAYGMGKSKKSNEIVIFSH